MKYAIIVAICSFVVVFWKELLKVLCNFSDTLEKKIFHNDSEKIDSNKIMTNSYKVVRNLFLWFGVFGLGGAVISIIGLGNEEKAIGFLGIFIMLVGLSCVLYGLFIKITQKPQCFYLKDQEIKIVLYDSEPKYIKYEQIHEVKIINNDTLLLKDSKGNNIFSMILSKDFTKAQILKIKEGIDKRVFYYLNMGKTFMEDPGFPIWPLVVSSVFCVCLLVNNNVLNNETVFISGIMFFCSTILSYIISYHLAKEEFNIQLKNDKLKNNLVTLNFIFRKFLVASFWWVLIIGFSLFVMELSLLIKLILFLGASIGISFYIDINTPLKNSCCKCGALWSYELKDCKASDVESHQELQYRITRDMHNNLVERPVLANVTTGLLHKVFECTNCGHKIKVDERFVDDGRSGAEKFHESMVRADMQGRGMFKQLTKPNLKKI